MELKRLCGLDLVWFPNSLAAGVKSDGDPVYLDRMLLLVVGVKERRT